MPVLAASGHQALFDTLHEQLRWRDDGLDRKGFDSECELGGTGLLLIPSAFWSGPPVFAIGDGVRLGNALIYAAQPNGQPADPGEGLPTEAGNDRLAALLGPTRAAVLRALAEPRGTAGLAHTGRDQPGLRLRAREGAARREPDRDAPPGALGAALADAARQHHRSASCGSRPKSLRPGRMTARTSAATAPDGPQMSGLMSSASRRSPRSAASSDRPVMASAIASRSAGRWPRAPASTAASRSRASTTRALERVTGRKHHAPFGKNFYQDTPGADDQEGTERGVTDQAQGQLGAGRGRLAHQDARAEAGGQVVVGGAGRLGARQAQPHSPDVGLVRDPRLVGLEHDRVADLGRGGQGPGPGAGGPGADGRDAVVAQQVEQDGAAGRARGQDRGPALAPGSGRGGAAGGSGRSAWSSRWRRASRPLRVPSRTGTPAARSRAAATGSTAAGRPASTATGLAVRAAAARTARG